MKLLVVLALVGLALADVKDVKYGQKTKYVKEEKQYGHEEKAGGFYNKQYSYHGKYGGKCDKDGFYYQDAQSFVICSNNNAYVQPCAPGSRNSGYEHYNYGSAYYYRDFCDINLVDHGYGVNHYGGYNDHKAPHYEQPKHDVSYSDQHLYHGKYGGKCEKDGFYYKNDDSFVICSNNNAYEQPCAPGTRNSAYNNFHQGSAYYYRDFCDVNLVDHGYGVHHGGYEPAKPQYGEQKHGYEQQEHYGRQDSYGHNDGYGYKYDGGYRSNFYGKPQGGYYGAPHGYNRVY